MAEYISKESAKTAVRSLTMGEGPEQVWSSDVLDAIERIQQWPNVVRVVRCMDCRYWHRIDETDGICSRLHGICEDEMTKSAWYCCDGRRR